jgi:hypothetical protein
VRASIKIEINIPGEVPDGTYVSSHQIHEEWPYDLYTEILHAASRMIGNIVGDRLARAASPHLPKEVS